MSSLFDESALPRLVQTSPPLSAPLQEAQMRTARTSANLSLREASGRIKSRLLFQTSGDAQLAESSTGHAARTHVEGLRVWIHLDREKINTDQNTSKVPDSFVSDLQIEGKESILYKQGESLPLSFVVDVKGYAFIRT